MHIPPNILDCFSSVRETVRSADLETARLLHGLTASLEDFTFRHVLTLAMGMTGAQTVTASAAGDSESRLLTASEAASLCGPSFTPKRLYRLRGTMPEQAWIRKGGRLYFREGPFRRWLATR